MDNPELRKQILNTSLKRASKWIKLSQEATPMVEQVGGRGGRRRKKPVLTMSNEYVLKPLATDHRGIREIAFYEAVVVAQSRSNKEYEKFLSGTTAANKADGGGGIGSSNSGGGRGSGVVKRVAWARPVEILDTLALALAMLVKDPVVQQSEGDLKKAWRAVRQEIESISHLNKFVPRYYGVVRHGEGSSIMSMRSNAKIDLTNYEESLDHAYLLLSRLSQRFSRPCIIDIKMGQETFEPDAPGEKMKRESVKYPEQEEFGFRITGMRIHDPSHPDADENGCRFFGKEYGRGLHTTDSIMEAFRLFFSCGGTSSISEEEVTDHEQQHKVGLRKRVISNVLLEVRSLRKWFEDYNKALEFRASSLLLIYDADQANGDVAIVRMIDFGRVRRRAGGDPGYRYGLSTLKRLLTELLEEEAEEPKASSTDEVTNSSDAG